MYKQPDEKPTQTSYQVVATPRYLLLEGKDPIGPVLMLPSSLTACFAVYGFSGKPAYDRFVANSDRELRPYPLMKGYLQNRAAAENTQLNLVVLDADGPSQQIVAAVTMDAALTAQLVEASQVDADYQLNLVPQTGVYRFSESSA